MSQLVRATRIESAVRKAFKELSKTGEVKKHLLPKLDERYREAMFQRFISSNASSYGFGPVWPELSPYYKKYKLKKRPGAPTLIFDGNMFKSFVNNTRQHVAIYRKGLARFGSRHYKAPMHDKGKDNLPVRVLRGGSARLINEMHGELKKYVSRRMKSMVIRHLRSLRGQKVTAGTKTISMIDTKRLIDRLG